MCPSLRIDGTFDDCQRLVKEAFGDAALNRRHRFSSANSINIGRLLPQMVYYVASSLDIERRTRAKAVLHHSGGQSRQCLRGACGPARSGSPSRASSWRTTSIAPCRTTWTAAVWQPRPSIATLASAMDVGNPSNMERMRALYPSWREMREQLSADSVDDATIRTRIGEDFMHYGREWCPHTATAAEVYSRLSATERRDRPWVVVATAHPAKFNEIVEPITRQADRGSGESGPAAATCRSTPWICRRRSRL